MAEFPNLPDPNKDKKIDINLHQDNAVFLNMAKNDIVSNQTNIDQNKSQDDKLIFPAEKQVNIDNKINQDVSSNTIVDLADKKNDLDIPKQLDYYSQKLSSTNIPAKKQSETHSDLDNANKEFLENIAKSQSSSRFWKIIKIILFIVGCFSFVYLFLNFPALYKKIIYNYQKNTGQKPAVQTIIPVKVNQDLLFLDTVTNYAPKNEETVQKLPSKTELGLENLSNNELYIPKLDIKAPIIWDSPVDEDTMLNNLKMGVVHYEGTAKPGQKAEDGEGNVFISGHSSYYWWDDGKYKTVFANLDQLNNDDQIAIGYEDMVYVYKVFEKKEVDPSETSVLKQDTDKHILSLMTCVPVGTNLRRLIVKSELIARGTDKEELKIDATEVSTPQNTAIPAETATVTPTPVASISNQSDTNAQTILDLLPWM